MSHARFERMPEGPLIPELPNLEELDDAAFLEALCDVFEAIAWGIDEKLWSLDDVIDLGPGGDA